MWVRDRHGIRIRVHDRDFTGSECYRLAQPVLSGFSRPTANQSTICATKVAMSLSNTEELDKTTYINKLLVLTVAASRELRTLRKARLNST